MNHRDWAAHYRQMVTAEPHDPHLALRQVGKTVLGEPIPCAQLSLLAHHIRRTLGLSPEDRCLDLGCGNGLLTVRLADHAAHVLGLDFSPSLLSVARMYYSHPQVRYAYADLTRLDPHRLGRCRFNRAFSCEVWQHLDAEDVLRLLGPLRRVMAPGYRILACGIPDQARLRAFYNTPARWDHYERNLACGQEQIGTWWDQQALLEVVRKAGMSATVVAQPTAFYTAHYRFDLLLKAG